MAFDLPDKHPMPPDSSEAPPGRIIASHSDRHIVAWQGQRYDCAVRGLLRKNAMDPLCGDWVVLDRVDTSQHTARITRILPRRMALTRPRVANIDQVVVVHSLQEPVLSLETVDRLLARAAVSQVDAVLCLTKRDLADHEAIAAIMERYTPLLTTPVLTVSIYEPDSLPALGQVLAGKATALAGPSGTGKSSLLNALNGDLHLRVADVSGKIGRGRHTTRHVSLLEVAPGAWVADTPGFSNLTFGDTPPAILERAFPDFAPFRAQCAFANCLHLEEDACGVRAQIGLGLTAQRYGHYVAFQAEARLGAAERKCQSAKQAYGTKTLDAAGRGATREQYRLKGRNREASRRVGRQQAARELPGDDDDTLTND